MQSTPFNHFSFCNVFWSINVSKESGWCWYNLLFTALVGTKNIFVQLLIFLISLHLSLCLACMRRMGFICNNTVTVAFSYYIVANVTDKDLSFSSDEYVANSVKFWEIHLMETDWMLLKMLLNSMSLFLSFGHSCLQSG